MTNQGTLAPTCYGCDKPAVILIVTDDDGSLGAYGVCADHAPEEAHEAACTMHPSEYLIVNVPPEDWRPPARPTVDDAVAWRDTAQQALRAHGELAVQLLDAEGQLESIITGQ